MAVRNEGSWEGWLKFFLRGVGETSLAATRTARSILELRESGRERVLQELGSSNLGHRLFDHLFEQPLVTVRMVEKHLGCSYAKANTLIEQFSGPNIGFLQEITGGQRNRLFRFRPYLELFEQPLPEPDSEIIETSPDIQRTSSTADTSSRRHDRGED